MSGQPAPLPVPPRPPLADEELAAWLRLLATPGVGRETARRLLAAFGSPQAVLSAGELPCRSVVGVAVAAALQQPPSGHAQQLAATRAWLAAPAADDPPRRVMVLGDADYPLALLNTADPPLLLYLEGCTQLLLRPSVAIVGSRKPTPQGRENARAFAAALVRQGWTVVSGLAAGVDGAAHEGALQAMAESAAGADSGGPGTVAVIGTGIDVAYPPAHKVLTRRIARLGLLVSELPLGAPPLAPHFPQRNRVIAGLSRGTLVVEAALRSGSLITARLASEAGREVFALPGSIHSDQSAGCHALIRQGAMLVTSVEQVLDELGALPPLPALELTASDASAPGVDAAVSSHADDDAVLRALGHDPASLDVLIARCGWPAHELSAHLLTLELSGLVARLPGGLFQRIQSG